MHKRLFTGATFSSLCLHVLALLALQSYSVWLRAPQAAPPSLAFEKRNKDQILKESFQTQPKSGLEKKVLQPKSENPASILSLSPEVPAPPIASPFQVNASQNLIAANDPLFPSFALPQRNEINLFEHLPAELYIPAMPQPQSSYLPAPLLAENHFTPLQTAPVQPFVENATPNELLLNIPSLFESAPLVKVPEPPRMPLPKLPTLEELQTLNLSNSFDAEISFLQDDSEKGYVFAITLIPRSDLQLPKLKQHYTFLIDRSNSIQKERLQNVKTAVFRALEEIDPNDTFNLYVFDSKAEKLSATGLNPNDISLAQAEGFLARIELGSFFSSANLDRPLMLTVPGQPQNDEIHTAILLTDAETLSKRGEQYALLSQWTSYNRGHVALFPVSMASDAHLATLELAAKSNKGRLVCAPTPRGMKRKLLKLMRSIHTPIAKNIGCKAVTASSSQKLDLYPKSSEAPHLYLDQPYTIIGSTDQLEDFVLFVQGRVKGGWLNIKKKISFAKARKGSKSLKAEWALQAAHNLYQQYLKDQNPTHLAEARELLVPYDYQVAFE